MQSHPLELQTVNPFVSAEQNFAQYFQPYSSDGSESLYLAHFSGNQSNCPFNAVMECPFKILTTWKSVIISVGEIFRAITQ